VKKLSKSTVDEITAVLPMYQYQLQNANTRPEIIRRNVAIIEDFLFSYQERE
jgi:hypothetical protein